MMNPNFRRNDKNNENMKDNIREHVEEYNEVFVKAKDLESSHVVLEGQSSKALESILKSVVVFDSSNWKL